MQNELVISRGRLLTYGLAGFLAAFFGLILAYYLIF